LGVGLLGGLGGLGFEAEPLLVGGVIINEQFQVPVVNVEVEYERENLEADHDKYTY
jgi:hypothetical protein